MSSSFPTVNQLRLAATGAAVAVGALAIHRGWLPDTVWSVAFCGVCAGLVMPKMSELARVVLRSAVSSLLLVVYFMSGMWRGASIADSAAITVLCLVPAVISVASYRRAKSNGVRP